MSKTLELLKQQGPVNLLGNIAYNLRAGEWVPDGWDKLTDAEQNALLKRLERAGNQIDACADKIFKTLQGR